MPRLCAHVAHHTGHPPNSGYKTSVITGDVDKLAVTEQARNYIADQTGIGFGLKVGETEYASDQCGTTRALPGKQSLIAYKEGVRSAVPPGQLFRALKQLQERSSALDWLFCKNEIPDLPPNHMQRRVWIANQGAPIAGNFGCRWVLTFCNYTCTCGYCR